MKNLLLIILISLTAHLFSQDNWVKGYYRKDGTYVEGYYRTPPNNTKSDNYSTKGNVNPYTGKPGTVNPDGSIGNTTTFAPNGTVISPPNNNSVGINGWINYGISKIISGKKKKQVVTKTISTQTNKTSAIKHTKFEYSSKSFSLKKDGEIEKTVYTDIKITIDTKNSYILFESDLGDPIRLEIISRKKAGENEVIFNINDTGIDAAYYMVKDGRIFLVVFPTTNGEPTSFYNDLQLISKS